MNVEVNYLGNPYPASYGISSRNKMNPISYLIFLVSFLGVLLFGSQFFYYCYNQVQPVAEFYPQYRPRPGSRGSYDMQRAQGHR